MPVQISIAKGNYNPNSNTGLTLGEPAFNYANNTLWMGKGSGVTPVWLGAGVCGASSGIAAGITYQIPTLGAVKDYVAAVGGGGGGAVSSVSGSGNGILVSPTTGAVVVQNTGVQSFNGLTGAVGGVTTSAVNTFTALQTFSSGISAAGGITLSSPNLTGTPTATTAAVGTNTTQIATTAFVQNEIVADTVTTFNGRTGAVQGVSATVAGTGISVSGATGSVTITNIGVQSFNGLTGAVTGVTVGGINTFTSLNSFNAGISSAGGTFSSLTRFTAGITASTLFVSSGATIGANTSVNGTVYTKAIQQYAGAGSTAPLYINADPNGNGGGNTITTIGDSAVEVNHTYFTVDDNSGVIVLHAPSGGINNIGIFNYEVTAPSFADTYSYCQTYRTTTTATTANQTIASVYGVWNPVGGMSHPAFEVTITAWDTVALKGEMLKMLVMQDGTNTVNTQYGLIRTGATGPVSSYSTGLTGGVTTKSLLIRATPLSANSINFTTTVRAIGSV